MWWWWWWFWWCDFWKDDQDIFVIIQQCVSQLLLHLYMYNKGIVLCFGTFSVCLQ